MGFRKWLANWILDGLNDEEECTCDECQAERDSSQNQQQMGYPGPSQAEIDAFVPPARYCIRASGMDYFVDNWKPGAGGMCIDVCWTQKIGGVEKPVFGTLFESSFTIIDYDSPMTVEAFEHVKKQNSDYITQMTSEAKATEDAKKKKEPVSSVVDASLAAYM